jgi:predicted RNase H-like HicB family nuclease
MLERVVATLKYDFTFGEWVAIVDSDPDLTGRGDTPEAAVRNLYRQAAKHDLWPKDASIAPIFE